MELTVTDTSKGYVFGKKTYFADERGCIEVPDNFYVAPDDRRFVPSQGMDADKSINQPVEKED